MTTQDDIELVEQATRHKLAFVQALLKRKNLSFSGTREALRARCIHYIDQGHLSTDELKALLESMDLWGNQRIRLIHIAGTELQELRDTEAVQRVLRRCGLDGIFEQELPLVIEDQVSPISIRYRETDTSRVLTLIAGKINEEWVPIDSLGELTYEIVAALLEQSDIENTRIVYRPFRQERRKIVSFAEIDLDTGHGIISVKTAGIAGSYKAKFDEFCLAFEPFLCLASVDRTYLIKAVSHIDDQSQQSHLDLPKQYLRDDQGARMRMEASSSHGDVRQHDRLRQARSLFNAEDSGDYCECYWQPYNGLNETVHTYIYGSQGEITFRGQVSEESIRYVLQRIRRLNS